MSAMTDETTTLMDLRRRMARFVADRDWQKYHLPKNLSMSLAIEAAELMEHFQWLTHEEVQRLAKDPDQRREIAHEMADVLSFLLSLANAMEIDLAESFQAKMAANEQKYPADEVRGHYQKPRQ